MKKKLTFLMVALLSIAAFATTMSVTMTKRAPVTELTVISEATTWDFSKLTITKTSANYNSTDDAIKLDGTTTPTNAEEMIYVNYADVDFTIGEGFNGAAIAFKGQYPIRKNNYAQNGELHFKTSVAGKIVVSFNDTGSKESNDATKAYKRYLKVNDTKTEYWTSRAYTGDGAYAAQLNQTSGEISVEAGDVRISGCKEDGKSAAIQVSKIVFTPDAGGSGDDPFKTKVDAALAAPVAGVATLTLDADYTVKSAINVPLGTQLVIDGANHTLTLGAETNFILQDGITLKNLKIDATALTKELIGLSSETPAEVFYDAMGYAADGANKTNYHITAPVVIDNCMIKELSHSIIKANASWALKNLTMTNNIIQAKINGDKFIAMNNGNSGIQTILIQNNTLYNTVSNSANFIAFNAANMPKGIWGESQNWMDWTFSNNTIVKFTTGNMGDRIQNNAVVKFTCENNLFVDQSKLAKWMTSNHTRTVSGNVYQKIEVDPAGDDTKNNYYVVADAGVTAPTAALDLTAENGGIDLKIGASTKAAKYAAGDPRWVVTYVAPEVDKTALETEITAATTLLGETAVDADPGKALSDAITAATTVKETGEFQEDIDAAVVALQAAEKAFAKAQLTAEITTATTLLGEAATDADPGKALKDAIDAATTVKDNAESTVTQLTDAVTTLKAAEEAFKTATGINGITVDGAAGDIFSDGKPVYNLSGQRVFKGYKGVVIKNGRKIVVK